MSHRMVLTARWMRAPAVRATLIAGAGICLLSGTALAAEKRRLLLAQAGSPAGSPSTPAASPSAAAGGTEPDQAGKAERVNVESIKQKYWARGEESELGVVQNRLYSKEHKVEIAGFYGFLGSDPFLNTSA